MRKGLPACRLAREGWLAPPLFLNVPHSTSVDLSHSHALAFSLILSLCSSFYLHFTLRLFFSSYRLRLSSSLSLHPSPFLDLSAFTFCSPRHAGRSFALVTTFPPTEPPTPRLYNDVNSHAHVFKSPPLLARPTTRLLEPHAFLDLQGYRCVLFARRATPELSMRSTTVICGSVPRVSNNVIL